MKKYFFITGLLCLFLTHQGSGQELKTNKIEVLWGVGNLQRQDINFSPFIHKSWSFFNPGIRYEHQGKQYHRVYARFGWYKSMIGKPFTYNSQLSDTWEPVETQPHNFNILDLNYALGFYAVKSDKSTLALGPQIRNLLNQGPYAYGETEIGAYNFSFGIDFWARYEHFISSKHMISAELSLPLLAWVAESPYLGQDGQYMMDSMPFSTFKIIGNYISRGKIESWNDFQRVDLQLGYAYTVNDRWNLLAEYKLNVSHSATPSYFSSIENVFLFGAALKL